MTNVDNEVAVEDGVQIIDTVEDHPKDKLVVKPLYQQLTKYLIALFLIAFTGLLFSLFLFYQQTEQTKFLISKQLTPLKQQYLQQQTLLKAKNLIDKMLIGDEVSNLTLQQKELIMFNRALIRLGSKQDKLYLQWLTINKANRDVVKRIQENSARNQQLKQSAVIQLQLMLSTLDRMVVKESKQENLSSTKQLLTTVLLGFEQLNTHTQLIDFDQLRNQVEQLLVKNTLVKKSSNKLAKITLKYKEQLTTFEQVTLSEQHALAKWQGYLRMTQKFDKELIQQQQQLQQLFDQKSNHSISFEAAPVHILPESITKFFVKGKVIINNELLIIISVSIIVFCVILFSYLLWRIRVRIQKFGQENIELIKHSLNEDLSSENSLINCKETQEIIDEIKKINYPEHSESEFLAQLKESEQSLLIIAEQRDNIEKLSNQLSLLNNETEEKSNIQFYSSRQQFIAIQQYVNQIRVLLTGSDKLTTDNSYQARLELAHLNEKISQYKHNLFLHHHDFALELSDVQVMDEIHSVLFNVLNKVRYQSNHILLNVDPLLFTHAKLDANLFEQLFFVYCDLAFSEQLNAQLTLNFKVKDQNNGQQLVYISGQIKTATKLKALPKLLQHIINSDEGTNATKSNDLGLVNYFYTLLSKQHGENLQARITEQGYQLSFELPLAIGSNLSKDKRLESDELVLKAINILLLTGNVNVSEIIVRYVKLAGATIETLTKAKYLNQSLNVKKLTQKPVDLIILSAETAITDYDFVLQTINSLPSRLRPKLMVLQTTQLSYSRYGLYSQTQELLCKRKLLQNICDLILSENSNNKWENEKKYIENQYVNVGVNILLGVSSPENHQVLQRILQWCGLQVTFVTQSIKQKESWKSGTFSLLMTEFEASPYIEFIFPPVSDNGIPIGVFSLAKPLVIEVEQAKNKYYKNWKIETIDTDISFESLISILEPWLVKAKTELKAKALIKKVVNTELAIKEQKKITTISPKGETKLASEFIFTKAVLSVDERAVPSAFSFSEYVIHQGTPEIALYMLDDYIQSNYQNFEFLSQAIKEKNILKAQKAVEKIQINAKILAANRLQEFCQQWLDILMNKTKNFHEVKSLLIDMKKEIIAIDKYAETI